MRRNHSSLSAFAGRPTLSLGLISLAASLIAAAPAQAVIKQPPPMWEFQYKSVVVGPTDLGMPAEQDNGASDQAAVRLPDGRVRLYYNQHQQGRPNLGIGSSISTDGIHFTVEPGVRIPVNEHGDSVGSGFAYALPGGGFRFYRSYAGAIVSATSQDGLSFTDDPGIRLPGNAWGDSAFGPPVCSAIAPIANGRYRMYCTKRLTGAGAGSPGLGAIVSAVSSDLLTWTAESGIRVGPGSNLTADAGHPSVIKSSTGGAITLIYHSYNYPYKANDGGVFNPRKAGTAMVVVTSKDGLSFSSPYMSGMIGGEVAWVSMSSTKGYAYGGAPDQRVGATLGVYAATLRSKGIGLNFTDMPLDVTGGMPSVVVTSAVGAICSLRVKDAGGVWLTNPRLGYKPRVSSTRLVSWTWQISASTKQGTATAVATCKLGSWIRTRSTTFPILV